MKYSFFVIILMILAMNSFAQVQQEWVNVFRSNNISNDYPIKIEIDLSGNIFVLGHNMYSNLPNKTILIKYANNGALIWNKIISTSEYESDYPISIISDTNCNIYVCSRNSNRIVTIKYDSSGNVIWEKKFSGGYFAENASIELDEDQNLYLAAEYSGGRSILKYNPNGSLLWQKQILGGNGIAPFKFMKLDNNNDIILTYFDYFYMDDIIVVKFSSMGDSIWSKRFNSGLYDHPRDIDIDENNNIYILGSCDGTPIYYNNYVFVLIKYDAMGNMKWVRKYDGDGALRNYPVNVKIDRSSNIYVAGTANYSNSKYDYTLIKYNSSGDSLWVTRFNDIGNNDDIISNMCVDFHNDVYLTGYSKDESGLFRISTVKYDHFGNVVWLQHLQNNYASHPAIPNASLVLDRNFNLYVLGGNTESNNEVDLITVKYSQSAIGILVEDLEIPNLFSLHQNYPNPFNPSTKIKFEIPLSRGVSEGRGVLTKLSVYDILGREVRALVNENLKQGIYEIDFNASELPSGVYFYKFQAGEFTDTKKMILVK